MGLIRVKFTMTLYIFRNKDQLNGMLLDEINLIDGNLKAHWKDRAKFLRC